MTDPAPTRTVTLRVSTDRPDQTRFGVVVNHLHKVSGDIAPHGFETWVTVTTDQPAPAEPVTFDLWTPMEYAEVHSISALNSRMLHGWRLRSAHLTPGSEIARWFLVERPITDDGAEATLTPNP